MPSSSQDQEREWARQLAKSQQSSGRWKNQPLDRERDFLAREMEDHKHFLKQAIVDHNPNGVSSATKKLIELRAQQAILSLKKIEEEYGAVEPELVKPIVKRYVKDVKKLTDSVQTLMKAEF